MSESHKRKSITRVCPRGTGRLRVADSSDHRSQYMRSALFAKGSSSVSALVGQHASYQYAPVGDRTDRTGRGAIVADELTRHVKHMLAVVAELKKVILAFRQLPVPADLSIEEAEIRNRVELGLCRVNAGLIAAPALTEEALSPTVH
jgi:hypothetical protein